MYTFNESAHVHSLDGQPLMGTSTVIKDVMPPFLAKWGASCAADYIALAGKPIYELEGVNFEDTYLVTGKQIKDSVSAWSKVRQKAADKGTDMHADMEKYVVRMITDFDGRPQLLNDADTKDEAWEKVQKFAEWANANVKRFVFAEKNTYSKTLWVGGVIDCVAEMNDGTFAIIDFKSSKEAYFNQFVQCAGYAYQVEESGWGNADGSEWNEPLKIGKLIIIPFGGKTLKPETIENVQGYKEVFAHVVEIYKYLSSFNKK